MKLCPRCNEPITNPRKKYCDDRCRYWFNMIKREKESHLPPVRKRTHEFFRMVTGWQWNSLRGQGRRSGGMIRGAMAARIQMMTEEIAPVTAENLQRHFFGNAFGLKTATLGDGSTLTIEEAKNKYKISA